MKKYALRIFRVEDVSTKFNAKKVIKRKNLVFTETALRRGRLSTYRSSEIKWLIFQIRNELTNNKRRFSNFLFLNKRFLLYDW
jgi:hypothetical protein